MSSRFVVVPIADVIPGDLCWTEVQVTSQPGPYFVMVEVLAKNPKTIECVLVAGERIMLYLPHGAVLRRETNPHQFRGPPG